eukprot:5211885-Pyramimonas_sp.AAC.1
MTSLSCTPPLASASSPPSLSWTSTPSGTRSRIVRTCLRVLRIIRTADTWTSRCRRACANPASYTPLFAGAQAHGLHKPRTCSTNPKPNPNPNPQVRVRGGTDRCPPSE